MNKLIIFTIIGVIGFILCNVADVMQNKGLQFAIQENFTGEDGKPAIPRKKKQQIITLNIVGYICMLAAFFSLLYYGYFDKYIAMLFG